MTLDEFNRIQAYIEANDLVKGATCDSNYADSIGFSCDYNSGSVAKEFLGIKRRELIAQQGYPVAAYNLSAMQTSLTSLAQNAMRANTIHIPYALIGDEGNCSYRPNRHGVLLKGARITDCPPEIALDASMSAFMIREANLCIDLNFIDVFLDLQKPDKIFIADVLSAINGLYYERDGLSLLDAIKCGFVKKSMDVDSTPVLTSLQSLMPLDGSKPSMVVKERNANPVAEYVVVGRSGDSTPRIIYGTNYLLDMTWTMPLDQATFYVLSSHSYGYDSLDLYGELCFDGSQPKLSNDYNDPLVKQVAYRTLYDYYSYSEAVPRAFDKIGFVLSFPINIVYAEDRDSPAAQDYYNQHGYYPTVLSSVEFVSPPETNGWTNERYRFPEMEHSPFLSYYFNQGMEYGGYVEYNGQSDKVFSHYFCPTLSDGSMTNYNRKIQSTSLNNFYCFGYAYHFLFGDNSEYGETYASVPTDKSLVLSTSDLSIEAAVLGDMFAMQNEISAAALSTAIEFIDSSVQTIGDFTKSTKDLISGIVF